MGHSHHTENKGLQHRRRRRKPLCTKKSLLFLIIYLKINIILAMTLQYDADQYVLFYTRNKTLQLGTSMHKPYCSELHILNQQYLHTEPAVLSNTLLISSPWASVS